MEIEQGTDVWTVDACEIEPWSNDNPKEKWFPDKEDDGWVILDFELVFGVVEIAAADGTVEDEEGEEDFVGIWDGVFEGFPDEEDTIDIVGCELVGEPWERLSLFERGEIGVVLDALEENCCGVAELTVDEATDGLVPELTVWGEDDAVKAFDVEDTCSELKTLVEDTVTDEVVAIGVLVTGVAEKLVVLTIELEVATGDGLMILPVSVEGLLLMGEEVMECGVLLGKVSALRVDFTTLIEFVTPWLFEKFEDNVGDKGFVVKLETLENTGVDRNLEDWECGCGEEVLTEEVNEAGPDEVGGDLVKFWVSVVLTILE